MAGGSAKGPEVVLVEVIIVEGVKEGHRCGPAGGTTGRRTRWGFSYAFSFSDSGLFSIWRERKSDGRYSNAVAVGHFLDFASLPPCPSL